MVRITEPCGLMWVQGDSEVGGAFVLLGGCKKKIGGLVV